MNHQKDYGHSTIQKTQACYTGVIERNGQDHIIYLGGAGKEWHHNLKTFSFVIYLKRERERERESAEIGKVIELLLLR